ncbi:Fur family transcriptional regulator [Gulosibacter sp. ACHW.36C]|uniref:Transcriptional repressor n=1 Tax=Gulosibacter sediminis TaxID=1729695 RepID=A0ABY4MZX6_9MICO|nr:transcriptional repressor [Gulosibacter sediminis]UQN14768.1 transcriptional repressor [Gulosibacter sediminis]
MSEQERVVPRRTTKQREAIREALAAEPAFVSAQDLHHKLRDGGERIGLATVYRALAQLAEDGDADTMLGPDGERYRACDTAQHHHHLVCRGCGHTVEVEAPEVEAWAAKVAKQHGFSAITHDVEVFGLCAECAAAA